MFFRKTREEIINDLNESIAFGLKTEQVDLKEAEELTLYGHRFAKPVGSFHITNFV